MDGKHVAYPQVGGTAKWASKFASSGMGNRSILARIRLSTECFLNPDGARLGYVANGEGRKGMVVSVDGQSGPSYLTVQGASFSPDGKHYAYIGEDKRGSRVVVDGKKGAVYDKIVQLSFSPNDEIVYAAAPTTTHVRDWRKGVSAGLGCPVHSDLQPGWKAACLCRVHGKDEVLLCCVGWETWTWL